MKEYEFKLKVVGDKLMVVSPSGNLTKAPKPGTAEYENLRREYAIEEMELQYDELIDQLLDIKPLTPEYDEALNKLGAFEAKMAILLRPPVSDIFSNGIKEHSLTAIKNGTL